MKLSELRTPAIILDIDAFESNINRFHSLALENDKKLWPMIKTHKSTQILQYQINAGSDGVLCGTLDECEAAAETGIENIMYAYPVADEKAIERIIKLSKITNFIIRIDTLEAAEKINKIAKNNNQKINYTVIINSGLNRFGIKKEEALNFIKEMKKYKYLEFKGISSHPGHVYEATKPEEVDKYVEAEIETLKYVKEKLAEKGIDCEYITSGSTPTFLKSVKDDTINIFHPGNYVFLDAIQMSLGIAEQKDCALRILATIVSNPEEGKYIMDAGAKCLGLDKGAHGNTSIVGHGKIIDHEEAVINSLSEEVGKISASQGSFQIGDRIQIIPNHACSSANLTSYIYGYQNKEVKKIFEVDFRSNSNKQI